MKAENRLRGDCLRCLLELEIVVLTLFHQNPSDVGPGSSIFNKLPEVILRHSDA